MIKTEIFSNFINEKYGLKLGELNNSTGSERVKKELKKSLLEILKTEDSYIEFNEITRKLKQCKMNKV